MLKSHALCDFIHKKTCGNGKYNVIDQPHLDE